MNIITPLFLTISLLAFLNSKPLIYKLTADKKRYLDFSSVLSAIDFPFGDGAMTSSEIDFPLGSGARTFSAMDSPFGSGSMNIPAVSEVDLDIRVTLHLLAFFNSKPLKSRLSADMERYLSFTGLL